MAKKEAIFDRYAANLAKVHPELEGTYRCPLTLRDFSKDQIDELSREHCIPAGLGPERIVLTDERANNEAGSKIEASLHRWIRYIEFCRDGVGAYPLRMSMGDAELGVTFTRDEETGMHFQIEKTVSNPQHIADAQKAAEKGNLPETMPLRFHRNDGFNERYAKIALLKAAYLMLFRQLGYSLILHRAFDPVRGQIREPSDSILPVEKLVLIVNGSLPRPLFWVHKPEYLFAWGYEFHVTKDENAQPTICRVCLPCSPYSASCWADIEKEQQVSFRFPRTDVDYLSNPREWISDC